MITESAPDPVPAILRQEHHSPEIEESINIISGSGEPCSDLLIIPAQRRAGVAADNAFAVTDGKDHRNLSRSEFLEVADFVVRRAIEEVRIITKHADAQSGNTSERGCDSG